MLADVAGSDSQKLRTLLEKSPGEYARKVAAADAAELAKLERPDKQNWHLERARILFSGRDYDGAIAEDRAALQINPNSAVAHFNIGYALFNKGLYDGATAEYRAAIQLDPSNAEGHCNLGTALDMAGRVDEAISEYRAALGLDPHNSIAQRDLEGALRFKQLLAMPLAASTYSALPSSTSSSYSSPASSFSSSRNAFGHAADRWVESGSKNKGWGITICNPAGNMKYCHTY